MGEKTPPESVDAERVRKSGTRRKREKKQNVRKKARRSMLLMMVATLATLIFHPQVR